MFSLFWRYLFLSYSRVFFLSVFSFVSVLVVLRLKEIAHFATLAVNSTAVLLFTAYQIPFILPMAIPISSLIAAMLLFQKFSKNQELTALRTAGLSLQEIISPLLLASIFFTICNFFLVSEVTSYCYIRSKEILYTQSSLNPLSLLQKDTIWEKEPFFVEMESTKNGQSVKDLFIYSYSNDSKRIQLFTAEKLYLSSDLLKGKNLCLLSYKGDNSKQFYDSLFLEKQKSMETVALSLSSCIKPKNHLAISPAYLPMKNLLLSSKNPLVIFSEITRRISLAFSTFTLTFIGICFGMEIGRRETRKGLFFAASLSLFVLFSLTLGKSVKGYPIIASLLYILPHPIVLFFSSKKIRQIARGIE